MKYLLLLQRAAGEDLPEFGTPEATAMVSEWTSVTDAMRAAGVLIDCAPLASASAATTVRVRDGQTLLTDGPAAELKEQVGGYTLIECADLDEAIK
ncbi:MAG: YciI family protein, partial [Nocardiopsaceae bacterium]|nr:YciI family protein [Nocardiopsaceae bacterium]